MAVVLCLSYGWSIDSCLLNALGRAGHNLLTTPTGQEGLRSLKEHPVEVLVMGCCLPDMPVETFASQAKAHNPKLPIVMVTPSMPVPGQQPANVDFFVVKSHCSTLLVPTIELSLARADLRGSKAKSRKRKIS